MVDYEDYSSRLEITVGKNIIGVQKRRRNWLIIREHTSYPKELYDILKNELGISKETSKKIVSLIKQANKNKTLPYNMTF